MLHATSAVEGLGGDGGRVGRGSGTEDSEQRVVAIVTGLQCRDFGVELSVLRLQGRNVRGGGVIAARRVEEIKDVYNFVPLDERDTVGDDFV